MVTLRRVLLLSVLIFAGACSQGFNKTSVGALGGATAGAGLGAIIGSQTGHAGPGIAIGAAAGLLTGALVGNQLDGTDERQGALAAETQTQREQLEENRRLIEALRKGGADVRSTDRGVVINLPDVLFEFDSDRLTREARVTAEEISSVLKGVEHRRIAVEGHTDSVGSVTYNKELSERRAGSVADELNHRGVSRRRLRVTGFGEGAPIATNNTSPGRARNRRVEIIIEN